MAARVPSAAAVLEGLASQAVAPKPVAAEAVAAEAVVRRLRRRQRCRSTVVLVSVRRRLAVGRARVRVLLVVGLVRARVPVLLPEVGRTFRWRGRRSKSSWP